MTRIRDFVAESNRIEGIHRDPMDAEVTMLLEFINARTVTTPLLQEFVAVYQPDAVIRDQRGLNVYIGNHVPPKGGSRIRTGLLSILEEANSTRIDAHAVHVAYETLHPFTDCNGRSGRALWAWMKNKRGYAFQRGFLHEWYYDSLGASR